MTLPDTDSLPTYGGGLVDYSPVIDSTTDRPAAGANPAYASVAMMTHTLPRAITRFSPVGSGTPVLAASGLQYEAVWLAATSTAPVLARTGTGVYTITWPATVADEILSSGAGYNASGHSTNLRCGWYNVIPGASTVYGVSVSCSVNVVTVKVYTIGTSTLVDPNDASIFEIYAR